MSEYLSVTATAKLVRQALKREFPDTKFSVRSHTYSGGSSISVHWTDGPQRAEVDRAAQPLSGGRFVFTERVFSDGYRADLERAVVLLAGDAGPFDGAKRYGFGLKPGGKWFESYGDDVVWQLSQVPQAELDAALEREAKRRAAQAATEEGESMTTSGHPVHMQALSAQDSYLTRCGLLAVGLNGRVSDQAGGVTCSDCLDEGPAAAYVVLPLGHVIERRSAALAGYPFAVGIGSQLRYWADSQDEAEFLKAPWPGATVLPVQFAGKGGRS